MSSNKDGIMLILSSPSGAGKTTLVKLLSKNKNFHISISHTTRKPRLNEIPDEDGEINKRNAIYSDNFVDPYPNDQAAKAANNGAYPPDLTLIVKARKDGANYLRSLLLGYEEAPAGFDVGEGYYNKYMAGNIIAMPQPLYGEDVEYQDGTKATLEQEVLDLVTFLTWTSMPELEKRKSSGIKVILFLIVMTFFFFLSYKQVWKDIK